MVLQKNESSSEPSVKKGKVVAITGAFGFIGSNLIKYLDADDNYERIIAIDIKKPSSPMEKLSYYKLDLTQPAADLELIKIFQGEKVDIVVHLAFLGIPSHNYQWAHELEAIGTLKVLTACAAVKVKKLIMWSLTMVYGAHPSNPNFLKEDYPKRGELGVQFVNDKLEAEQEVLSFAQKNTGMVVTILRTCTILGPTVNNIVTKLLSRRLIHVPMGYDPLMQFIHEVDVTDAFKLVIDHDFPGDFNIVGDGVLPMSTILKLAGKIPVPIPFFIDKAVHGALWSAQFTNIPPGFLNYFRYIWLADGEKAKKVMNFIPKYSTKESLLNFLGTLRLRKVKIFD